MKRLLPAGVSLWVLALASPALAQDFFELSPGPLTHAHAALDNADNCTKCHELGKGVTDLLCLNCHQHEPLKKAIEEKRGLHANFKQPCRVCHTEHKGREAFVIDWGPLGGRNAFKHEQTGFRLTGKHESAACSKCHKRTLRSGRTSYVDVPPDCNQCHQNNHSFTNKELTRQCEKCHQDPGIAKNLKPDELPFNHGERTKTALEGKHATQTCVTCHKGAKMSMTAGNERTCVNCHKNPHGKTFKTWACTECHSVTTKWEESKFDHDKTEFPLTGEHKKALCSDCHKTKNDKPKTTCSGCHGDPHKKRFEKVGCERCHDKGGSTQSRFDHQKNTNFALTGAHEQLGCRKCHRGAGPTKFEKFANADCMSCHAHEKAHNGQFKDKNCLECHVEGGNKNLVFDHNKDSRFPLTGFHAEMGQKRQCEKCHEGGTYRNNKLACLDCHKDSHEGQLGKDCQRCHKTDEHFKGMKFDHNLASFKLEGEHQKAECEKCHPQRRYKLEDKTKCVDCHKDDDPHQEKLGAECEKCHTPTKGAPKFDHEVMTKFARTGAHLEAKCFTCHRPKMEPAPEVGWTKKLAADEKLDRHFPVMGGECVECHKDRHDGRYGKKCDSCHDTSSFKDARRAVHDTGSFRLMGAHDRVGCQRCHEQNRILTGLGELCQGCHREDDIHVNALGPYCGECHGQLEWRPPRFNHARVGFVLRGAHRTARCNDCHGATNWFAGTPTECQVCHGVQATQVPDPVHNGSFMDCARCHNEVSFSPARRYHPTYPLTGAHATVRCGSCHVGGRYEGTPRDCFGCHQSRYLDPTTKPNHTLAGFSTSCESCHVPVSFNVARYQHQNFLLRGTHRSLGCDRCHPGEQYFSAFAGQVGAFECALCHGAGAPVDRWPQDHAMRGYPITCELCHNELGWKPARAPR